MLVGGEGLHRGPLEVLGTLLHEAAHGLAQARQLQDTSRQGRYHNRRYATLARELGLEVASVKPIGWSATTVSEPTAAGYRSQLEQLAAVCGCGRRIRVAKATLAEALIVCGACAGPFQPADPDEDGN